jgi:hypothetical protein
LNLVRGSQTLLGIELGLDDFRQFVDFRIDRFPDVSLQRFGFARKVLRSS